MTRTRQSLLALACALVLAGPALAAPAAPAPQPATSVTRAKARRASVPAPAAEPASRRLAAVHIEGELEVPRVTFITVRQPHRFRDYTRATSVRSSRSLAADATFPAWIPPAPTPASDARKENRK